MENNNEDKVSVSNNSLKKRRVVQKIAPKNKIKKKTAIKESLKKNANAKPTKSIGKKNNIISTIISIVITALVVGSSFYAWQKDNVDGAIGKIKVEARNARMDMEKRLTNVKDKLQGVENENNELKTKNEELLETANLLKNAKVEFKNIEIGFSFDYPANFGEVKITIEKAENGKRFLGEFLKNDKLKFGGIAHDYKVSTSTSVSKVALIQSSGYVKDEDKYYFSAPGLISENYEITPVETLKTNKENALLVNKSSFPKRDASSTLPIVDVGENLGAIINLEDEQYSAVTFENSDFSMMSVDDFKKMIKSIKLINK